MGRRLDIKRMCAWRQFVIEKFWYVHAVAYRVKVFMIKDRVNTYVGRWKTSECVF